MGNQFEPRLSRIKGEPSAVRASRAAGSVLLVSSTGEWNTTSMSAQVSCPERLAWPSRIRLT